MTQFEDFVVVFPGDLSAAATRAVGEYYVIMIRICRHYLSIIGAGTRNKTDNRHPFSGFNRIKNQFTHQNLSVK